MSTWHVELDIAQSRLALTAVKDMREFYSPDEPAFAQWFDLQLHLEKFLNQHDENKEQEEPVLR